jgi:hypothetical protein
VTRCCRRGSGAGAVQTWRQCWRQAALLDPTAFASCWRRRGAGWRTNEHGARHSGEASNLRAKLSVQGTRARATVARAAISHQGHLPILRDSRWSFAQHEFCAYTPTLTTKGPTTRHYQSYVTLS